VAARAKRWLELGEHGIGVLHGGGADEAEFAD
jgi:hypothetical protein